MASLPVSVTSADVGPDHEEADYHLNEADVEILTTCLEEITKVYSLAPTLVVSVLIGVKLTDLYLSVVQLAYWLTL